MGYCCLKLRLRTEPHDFEKQGNRFGACGTYRGGANSKKSISIDLKYPKYHLEKFVAKIISRSSSGSNFHMADVEAFL